MGRLIVLATVLVLLAPGGAWAAEAERSPLDVLRGIVRGDRTVTGHVVAADDTQLVLRAEDGRTYAVSTVGLGADTPQRLKPGQPVTARLQGTGEAQTLVASSIQPGQGATRTFGTVNGTVQAVTASQVQFQTTDGLPIPLVLSDIVGGRPQVQSGMPATLIYEQTPSHTIAAVWVQPRAASASGPSPAGAASVASTTAAGAASPSTTAASGAYQKVHGFVQSIGVATLSLKTDDGRTLDVDTQQVAESVRSSVRPGDVVSVVGRGAGEGRFSAELIQKDDARR